MKPIELKAARELLCLTQPEAARYLADDVSLRTWQYFETGKIKIKQELIDRVNFLLNRRREVLREVQSKMLHPEADLKQIAVIYYEDASDCANVLEWRFSQSLAKTLALDYGAKLVKFDQREYTAWLAANLINGNPMEDTPENRATWAGLQ